MIQSFKKVCQWDLVTMYNGKYEVFIKRQIDEDILLETNVQEGIAQLPEKVHVLVSVQLGRRLSGLLSEQLILQLLSKSTDTILCCNAMRELVPFSRILQNCTSRCICLVWLRKLKGGCPLFGHYP